MPNYKPISKEKQEEVIEYFTKNKNNSTKAISIHFGMTKSRVNTIINQYLKSKTQWQNKAKEERSQYV